MEQSLAFNYEFNYLVAELSLALAGFSGVIVGLGRSGAGSIDLHDRFGLLHILLCSGFALIFSLLPVALSYVGLSVGSAHSIASATLACTMIFACAFWMSTARTTKPRHRVAFWSLASLGLLIGFAMLISVAGFANAQNFFPIALLWHLLVGFVQFFYFLISLSSAKQVDSQAHS